MAAAATEKESTDDSFHFYLFCGLLAFASLMGYVVGHRVGARSARETARKETLLEAALQKRRAKSQGKRDEEVNILEYQVAKNTML